MSGHRCTHEEALAACTELSMALVAEALERKRAERERDQAREESERLRAELTSAGHMTGWMVARNGGRDCVRCDGEIRRCEAYELMPGVDELQHVHCPDREAS